MLDTQRLLDPCGKYKDHKLEDLILACGLLPTHIDENNPVRLIDQVCAACNVVKAEHGVRSSLKIDELGVVYGDGGDVYYPLAVIARKDADGGIEALYVHNGGQMIVRDDADEQFKFYSMVVTN